MSDAVAFVRARLDEREEAARAAGGQPWVWLERGPAGELVAPTGGAMAVRIDAVTREHRKHIALNDPAYALADIAAKRRIVDEIVDQIKGMEERIDEEWCAGDPVNYDTSTGLLRLLAAPFAGHPDYDPAWAVPAS